MTISRTITVEIEVYDPPDDLTADELAQAVIGNDPFEDFETASRFGLLSVFTHHAAWTNEVRAVEP